MKIAVVGNGHLATVYSVCLAHGGHTVNGPVFPSPLASEPRLAQLAQTAIESGLLDCSCNTQDKDIVIVAWDTDVDPEDHADTRPVLQDIYNVASGLRDGLIVIAAQLPVGFIAKCEKENPHVRFACCPENLTRGNAVDRFLHADRIVCGIRRESDKAILINLWEPFGRIEWMSIESAEMSKHAINAFLATSICFANEIAEVARRHGADPREVERALKSDSRIGQRAYLRPGEPYTGGTLGRDVRYLEQMTNELEFPLLNAVRASNDTHKAREAETVSQ